MKKVAVFGKPGSGKSTLAKRLAVATGIPLHPLDSIVYAKNGDLVDRESYDKAHDSILACDNWILDGFGPLGSFNKRLEVADTLIYIDLPYVVSYWLVTKRLLKGLFVKPEGWPDGSSVFKGTLQSYKMLKLSPKFYNGVFLNKLRELQKNQKPEQTSANKNLYVIRSVAELNSFVEANATAKVNSQ